VYEPTVVQIFIESLNVVKLNICEIKTFVMLILHWK